MTVRADIFCKVIDNFGDLGVCWRFARQLHHEHAVDITLWVDDLHSFARMAPVLDPLRDEQWLDGIRVRWWHSGSAVSVPGDLVIEGFGCPLPHWYMQAMAAMPRQPVWLNLEYLSAEDWVEGCHGLPSTHPLTGLTQYFWFPGFTPKTGGLLREADLLTRRDRFQADASLQSAFWSRIGVPDALSFESRASLFAYETSAIAGWLQGLAEASGSALVLVPAGRALAEVARWAGVEAPGPGDRIQRGQVTVVVLPFLSHDDYDLLLWACDVNVVRGEDSFVRAQWAGRPLLWHIYPQEDGAHWAKLEAFMGLVVPRVSMPAPWAEAMRAWNRGEAMPSFWAGVEADRPGFALPARAWSDYLAAQTDLVTSVMRFYASQVE